MRTNLVVSVVVAAVLAACTSRGAQQPRAGEQRREGPVATAQAYEMKGNVQAVGGVLGVGRSITIARKDAPAAQLHVAEQTRITLDDRPAALSDLREGDEVRAMFDFDASRPVALEIKAKKGAR